MQVGLTDIFISLLAKQTGLVKLTVYKKFGNAGIVMVPIRSQIKCIQLLSSGIFKICGENCYTNSPFLLGLILMFYSTISLVLL